MTVQEIRFQDLEDFRNNLPSEPGDKWIFRGEEYTENPNDALKTTLQKSFEQFGLEDAQENKEYAEQESRCRRYSAHHV